MWHQDRMMRVSLSRMIHYMAATLSVVGFCLVVYQNFARTGDDLLPVSHVPESNPEKAFAQYLWQERAPRSVNPKDYDHNYSDLNLVENKLVKKTSPPSIEAEPNNIEALQELYEQEKRKSLSYTIVASATTKPPIALDDIFISVKTTKAFHKTRLDLILKTWFNLAKKQTWFFTDTNDPIYQQRTNGHMINTKCSSSHNRKALCCKMAVEFDAFLESNKRWFCHFDDDNYVNVPTLVRTLADYNPLEDWYLGKTSIRAPLEIVNRDKSSSKRIAFWFATGGAGFCLSRSLALKMVPVAGGGKFVSVGEKIRLPDDVTMGYIIEHLLGKQLTVVEEFHSHLEPMRFVSAESLREQISLSYSQYGADMNVVSVSGVDERIDPTRFLSIHCHLFPHFNFCPR